MNKDVIIMNEATNDGQTIYLYYDAMIGGYLACGLSAFYITMVTEPFMSYSDELQMPVALLRREHILYLRQSLTKVDHAKKEFYIFQMRTRVGDAGYNRWAQNILTKHQGGR